MANWQATAQRLAIGDQIRHDIVIFLRTTVGQAKAGDDFIEDERDLGVARKFPQAGQESG